MKEIIDAHKAVFEAVISSEDTAPHTDAFKAAVTSSFEAHENQVTELQNNIEAANESIQALEARLAEQASEIKAKDDQIEALEAHAAKAAEEAGEEKATLITQLNEAIEKASVLEVANKEMAAQIADTPIETLAGSGKSPVAGESDPLKIATYYLELGRQAVEAKAEE